MQEYEQQIKLKFKALSAFYDLFDIPFYLTRRGNPRLALAAKIPNQPLRILDVCIGTANSAITVSQANDQNEIAGIDLSPDMISVAESKIRKRSIRNISIRQMDATRMSYRDGEFDVVMVSFGLHEMDHELMMDVLQEMSRVLKESGKFYIIDYEQETGLIKKIILSIHLKIFEPSHMPQFLQYNWNEILQKVGLQFTSKDKYLFSKLISAAKNSA